MIEWKKGTPPMSGYYLATWQRSDSALIVSELWFNALDHGGQWWAARGYLEGFHRVVVPRSIDTVVAWAPMPAPAEAA